jgi:hypothetical protein
MHYTYDCWKEGVRFFTTTNFKEVPPQYCEDGNYVEVADNRLGKVVKLLDNKEDYVGWSNERDRDIWLDPVPVPVTTNPVDPKHYKDYILNYEWLEAMSRIKTLRDPERFTGGLEFMVRKYLDRRGGKDAELQELKKSRVYLQVWISYLEHGDFDIADIQDAFRGMDAKI